MAIPTHAEYVADIERRKQAEADAQQERMAAAAEEQRRRMLEPAKREFLTQGGTPEEWAKKEKEIERQVREQKVIDAAANAEVDFQRRVAAAARKW